MWVQGSFRWNLSTVQFEISPNESLVNISQVYYSLWRRLLKLFWWLVVAYTMLVLISIYTYQFEDFPGYWRNFTGFTEEQYALLKMLEMAVLSLNRNYYNIYNSLLI